MTYEAYKVDPRTSFLLVPYCAWLSFASYLNGKSGDALTFRLPLQLDSCDLVEWNLSVLRRLDERCKRRVGNRNGRA